MKQKIAFHKVAWGLLLGLSAGFSQIPDSVYSASDTTFRPMWNRTNLTADFWPASNNWSVLYPGTDTAVIRTNGTARPSGTGNWTNMNFIYRATPAQANLEVRFEFRMPDGNATGNAGFNFRSYCQNGTPASFCSGATSGWRINGPQFDLGPTYQGDIWNSGNARYAGSDVPSNPPNVITNTTACRAGFPAAVKNWGHYSFVLLNDTAFTYRYINGLGAAPTLCAKYFLTAATDKAATSQGFFGLQYETLIKSEWRSIEIRNITPSATSVKGAAALNALRNVTGAEGAVEFSIPSSGKYTVLISDVNGALKKTIHGNGPALNQTASLKTSGMFVVKISTSGGNVSKLVYVR